ncbi:MAG: hypothetical protein M2R45_02220 [Verrucomicrobia subdivision 3 bacterium]|nr:hypothetical protein [Limisphaerales bacterium]MCS1413995.1 hypothetical protein [Limisphaerales bacterium]
MKNEGSKLKRDIKDGDVCGLTDCICADSEAYDTLLLTLSNVSFMKGDQITPISGKPVTAT